MSDIYLSITETPTVVTLTNPLISSNVAQSVTVTNVVSVSVVTMPAISVSGGLTNAELRASSVTVALDASSLSALEQVTVTVGAAVSISNFPSTQTVAGTVTVGSLPSIAVEIESGLNNYAANYSDSLPIRADNPLPISGTVTANINSIPNVLLTGSSGDPINDGGSIPVFLGQAGEIYGTVTANASLQNSNSVAQAFIDESNSYGSLSVVLSGSAGNIGVVGAVTAAAPNGSLTTRFGTPATANVSFATSAVTNANRKYLLIQNVTTGSNVITVGIGFTPTTTQGIQLTAGAGITFESSYIPTGAVYVLSSVTASNFTILEA